MSVLAWLFNTLLQTTVSNFSKSPLDLRRDPRSKGLRDIMLIAIDFEQFKNIKQGSTQSLNSQVGTAVLDTKDVVFSVPQAANCLTV